MRGQCGDVGIGDPALRQRPRPDRAARRRVGRCQFQAPNLAVAGDGPLADHDQEGFQPLHRIRQRRRPGHQSRVTGRVGVDQDREAQQRRLPFD